MAERASDRLARPILGVARIMAALAGLCLIALIGLTLVDIVARSFAIADIRGVLELSAVTMVLLAYFALAWGFLRKVHIVVDLATSAAPEWLNSGLDRFWTGVAGFWLAFLAAGVWRAGFTAHESGERTMVLEWSPLALALPAAAGLALAALVCVMLALSGRFAGQQDRFLEEESRDV